MTDLTELMHRLDKHEAVCEERHKSIEKRFSILQWIMGAMFATMLGGFALVVSLLLALFPVT